MAVDDNACVRRATGSKDAPALAALSAGMLMAMAAAVLPPRATLRAVVFPNDRVRRLRALSASVEHPGVARRRASWSIRAVRCSRIILRVGQLRVSITVITCSFFAPATAECSFAWAADRRDHHRLGPIAEAIAAVKEAARFCDASADVKGTRRECSCVHGRQHRDASRNFVFTIRCCIAAPDRVLWIAKPLFGYGNRIRLSLVSVGMQ